MRARTRCGIFSTCWRTTDTSLRTGGCGDSARPYCANIGHGVWRLRRQSMSERSTAGLFTTAVFNPALLHKEDLVRGFVARQDILDRLLDDLRRVQPGSPPQHQLIVGQRGLGKTTLLRRLAFAIEDD